MKNLIAVVIIAVSVIVPCQLLRAEELKQVSSRVIEIPPDFKVVAIAGGIGPGSPFYKIELDARGNGTYWEVPENNSGKGDFIQKDSFNVAESGLRFVYETITEEKFFALKDEYVATDVLDGSFARLTITANGKTHSVLTKNMAVDSFDRIMIAVNIAAPKQNKVLYNEIIK